MSKKTKRQLRKESVSYFAPAKAEASSAGRSTDFNPDYSYITNDLRRIGILAGSFIVILIALSFFLR
jgi:hypothetical protein